jgi:hypothetical protein
MSRCEVPSNHCFRNAFAQIVSARIPTTLALHTRLPHSTIEQYLDVAPLHAFCFLVPPCFHETLTPNLKFETKKIHPNGGCMFASEQLPPSLCHLQTNLMCDQHLAGLLCLKSWSFLKFPWPCTDLTCQQDGSNPQR